MLAVSIYIFPQIVRMSIEIWISHFCSVSYFLCSGFHHLIKCEGLFENPVHHDMFMYTMKITVVGQSLVYILMFSVLLVDKNMAQMILLTSSFLFILQRMMRQLVWLMHMSLGECLRFSMENLW